MSVYLIFSLLFSLPFPLFFFFFSFLFPLFLPSFFIIQLHKHEKKAIANRGRRILRSGHFKRFIYSPRRLVCFYVGYRVGNSTPELPWQLSYVELVQKHKLNFLLKNYISKKIFQHIIGTGRSRGAFCYSFCSSGTSVTWEKVAKRGHFS